MAQAPADPVAVPDREDAQDRVVLGHEPPPVAGALAGGAGLEIGDVGAQLEGRLQLPQRRVLLEGVHAVDRDPAPDQVEVGPRLAQRGGAVGGVHDDAGMVAPQGTGPIGEAVELGREEPAVVRVVGGGEVGHGAGQLEAGGGRGRLGDASRLVGVVGAEPTHPAVELHVDAQRVLAGALGHGGDERLAPGHDVRAGRDRHVKLLRAQGTHHQQAGVDPVPTQRPGLLGGGHGDPGGPAGQRGPRAGTGAVAVAVRLDHRRQGARIAELSQ